MFTQNGNHRPKSGLVMVGGAIADPTPISEPPLITTPLDTTYSPPLRTLTI